MVELPIHRVVDEARTINRILRLENIALGGIINNDTLGEVTVDNTQVLDIISLVVNAGLAKEPGGNSLVGVKEVKKRIGILVEGSSVNYKLVELTEDF